MGEDSGRLEMTNDLTVSPESCACFFKHSAIICIFVFLEASRLAGRQFVRLYAQVLCGTACADLDRRFVELSTLYLPSLLRLI